MSHLHKGECGSTAEASLRAVKRETPLPPKGEGRRCTAASVPDYCTFRVKSSTTKEVCSEESSEPTRKTWMVCPLYAITLKLFCE
jgi:hypothetical protein